MANKTCVQGHTVVDVQATRPAVCPCIEASLPNAWSCSSNLRSMCRHIVLRCACTPWSCLANPWSMCPCTQPLFAKPEPLLQDIDAPVIEPEPGLRKRSGLQRRIFRSSTTGAACRTKEFAALQQALAATMARVTLRRTGERSRDLIRGMDSLRASHAHQVVGQGVPEQHRACLDQAAHIQTRHLMFDSWQCSCTAYCVGTRVRSHLLSSRAGEPLSGVNSRLRDCCGPIRRSGHKLARGFPACAARSACATPAGRRCQQCLA